MASSQEGTVLPRLHQQTPAAPPATASPADQIADLLRRQGELLTLALGLLKDHQRVTPREAWDGAELAAVLGMGLRSVRTLDSAGMLPKPIRVGSRVLWRVRELRAWLASGAPSRDQWERIKAERRMAKARRARR